MHCASMETYYFTLYLYESSTFMLSGQISITYNNV